MIALANDYLLFKLSSGERIPFSVEMISIEFAGDTSTLFDHDFVKQAVRAVFFYFKQELDRQVVTVGEFAEALEKVLQGFAQAAKAPVRAQNRRVIRADLGELACQSENCSELFFFPRLREQLRANLRQEPRELHFDGLRPCVKRLAGARRWSLRCQILQDQIVEFLRGCLTAEQPPGECALVVR
jgi:hypothetical protein